MELHQSMVPHTIWNDFSQGSKDDWSDDQGLKFMLKNLTPVVSVSTESIGMTSPDSKTDHIDPCLLTHMEW